MDQDRTRDDAPTRLRLSPGETAELDLPSLGPAGYLWAASVEGAGGTVILQWQRGERPADQPGRRPVGRGGVEVLRVTGAAPGSVTLHLAQRRPWETRTAARAVRTVEVNVREARRP